MRALILLALWLFSCLAQAADRPQNLTPLTRFYDKKRNVHAYAYSDEELAAWRAADGIKEHIFVGDITTMELPGTVRLWRAIREKDKKHFYYITAPRAASGVNVDNENFRVFVWKSPGDGRIPIYGSTWTDGTDVFFDPDPNNVKKFAADTKKALGIERKELGPRAVFYVYPHPKEEESQSKAK